jgi:diacylglycerol kinase (ATP)
MGRMSPTVTLVVNPTSGHGKAGRALPRVTLDLVKGLSEYTVVVRETQSYEEAKLFAAEAVAESSHTKPGELHDILLVMGGDGMANVGLNAAAGTQVRLGVIPAGTANDFCRGMGVPYTTNSAVASVIAGRERLVDLTEVTGAGLADGSRRRFVGSVVSSGYDAKVNYRTNSRSMSLGSLSYGWDAMAELAHFKPLNYRMRVDGQELDLPAMLIAVGNAGMFGGGMRVCPHADPTDGLLDITIVHPVGRLTLLRLLPSMYSGAFIRHPCVELLRGREIVVDGDNMFAMGDGESLGDVPLTARVAPQCLYLLGATKPKPPELLPSKEIRMIESV